MQRDTGGERDDATGRTGAGRRVVVVTGLEVVRRIAAGGDRPVRAARDLDRGRAAADHLRAQDGVEVDVVALDVTDPAGCAAAAGEVSSRQGGIRVAALDDGDPRRNNLRCRGEDLRRNTDRRPRPGAHRPLPDIEEP